MRFGSPVPLNTGPVYSQIFLEMELLKLGQSYLIYLISDFPVHIFF